jgi:hypothetical protein
MTEKVHKSGPLFSRYQLCINFDKKKWLGYILGVMFKNSSGRPDLNPPFVKIGTYVNFTVEKSSP